jgi:hypothetical protein
MAKNNYALRAPQPDSFSDDKAHLWPASGNGQRGVDSIPDPAKVLSAEQKAKAKQVEEEAYQRFLKNRNRYKATGKSSGTGD